MPQNVRNWWMRASVTGRSPLGFGPRSANGICDVKIMQRHKGQVLHVLTIDTVIRGDDLILRVFPGEDHPTRKKAMITQVVTQRD